MIMCVIRIQPIMAPGLEFKHVENVPLIYQSPKMNHMALASQTYVYHLNPTPYGQVWTYIMWIMSLSFTNPPNMNHMDLASQGYVYHLNPTPLWPSMDFYHMDNVPVIYQPNQFDPY